MRSDLEFRQRTEQSYHDSKTLSGFALCHGSNDGPDYRCFADLIGDLSGLRVLDYGCGDGWYSIHLALRGATVWGIDISSELIKCANSLASSKGLSRSVFFQKMLCESLDFDDNFFDLIVGSAILHHTDIELSIQNIHRVLRPGGRAVFIEPMNENPVLKLWRIMTPWRRSPSEKALLCEDIALISRSFIHSRFYYFYLLSIAYEGLITLLGEIKYLLNIRKMIYTFDERLLLHHPHLSKYCAVVVMELIK